ncbi:MAG: hypothetical protein H7Y13_11770 [Sphingobacteriaceae bacterium]|nr:hypothetical protein [Sphingobacteriaceae bacterium]
MEVKEFNRAVRFWSKGTLRKIRNEVLRMVLNVGPGYENQFADTKQYSGEINRIRFGFPYYMVFVHKGAGRGYGGKKARLDKKTYAYVKNRRQDSLRMMGTGRRIAKLWFNPVIEAQLPELASLITDYKGSKAIDIIQQAFNKLKID